MNYNVALCFLFRVCDGIATGIWSSSVLSNYIAITQGDDGLGNERVGIAQAIQGSFLVAAALPAAWLASHFRRASILRLNGLLAFCAIGATYIALTQYQGRAQFYGLCGALALWGMAQANAPILDALFADSVPTGRRAALYTGLHIAYILSLGLGPAAAAGLFFWKGDEWSEERMKQVMLVGMALAVVPAFLLLLFDDDKALGQESEGLLTMIRRADHASGDEEGGLQEHLLAGGGAGGWSDQEDEQNLTGFDNVSAAGSPAPGAYSPPATGTTPGPGMTPSSPVALSPSTPAPVQPHLHPQPHPPALSPGQSSTGSPFLPPPPQLLTAVEGAAAEGEGEGEGEGGDGDTGVAAVDLAVTSFALSDLSDGASTTYSAPSSINSALSRRSGEYTLAGAGAAPGSTVFGFSHSSHAGHGHAHAHGPSPLGPGGYHASSVHAHAQAAHASFGSSVMTVMPAVAEGEEGGGTSSGGAGGGGAAAASTAGGKGLAQRYHQIMNAIDGAIEQGAGAGATAPITAPVPTLLGLSALGEEDRTGSSSTPRTEVSMRSLVHGESSSGRASGSGSDRALPKSVTSGRPLPTALSPIPSPAAHSTAPMTSPFQNLNSPTPTRTPPRGAAVAGATAGAAAARHADGSDLASAPEGVHAAGSPAAGNGHTSPVTPSPKPGSKALRQGGGSPTRPGAPTGGALGIREQLQVDKVVCGCLGVAAIPAIIGITDAVMGLASGMTIKFFPVYFREQVHMSPAYVSLMYCGVPLALSTMSFLAQRLSKVLGRVQMMVMSRALGIGLMYWMAIHTEAWGDAWIMVPVYVVRTSIMNAIHPLQRSILMDYVSKGSRAKWASLESVTSFGWSGSAAVGGYLIHMYGFQLTFFITASMQLVGWLCSLLLLPVVPRKEVTLADVRRATAMRHG